MSGRSLGSLLWRAPQSIRTITELFWLRVEQSPDAEVFTFADDAVVAALDARSMVVPAGITIRELDRRARSVAAHLQETCAPGDRVILLEAPGLDFVAAYAGCLYAGMTAVPMYPPDPSRLARTLPRFQAVAADAKPAAMLTTATFLSLRAMLLPMATGLENTAFFDTRELLDGAEDRFQRVVPPPERLAMLQYTSGSTGTPKGVMLSQENMLANLASIHSAYGFDEHTRQVMWVPPYHDMGLIGGILSPIYGVYPTLLMSPVTFLKDPNRWLQALHAFRATASGGPNFAYDLTVRKFRPETFDALDLSAWRTASNGAEPVRVKTLEQFMTKFGPYGFRRQAMLPSYGLAEATLLVSGGNTSSVTPRYLNRAALEKQLQVVELSAADEGAREVIGCGAVAPLFDVRIVDPVTRTERRRDEAGEIWVAGPSIAQGYWGRADSTAETFDNFLADTGEGPFLRTGDLGFLLHDEVFITGRVKDLIIVHGRNHHPEDIEQTVENCDPAFRKSCTAAFSVEEDDDHVLVVLQEVNPGTTFDPQRAYEATAAAVAREHGMHLRHLVFLEPRALHKTSSGKISRAANRKAFNEQDLLVVGRAVGGVQVRGGDEPQTVTEVRLAALWEEVFGVKGVQRSTSLVSLGVDSIQIVEVVTRIQKEFDVPQLTPEVLRSRPGLAALARVIDERDFQLRSLDLGAETWLPLHGPDVAVTPKVQTDHTRILLTGANGFLGVYLLRELLNRSKATIFAMVRADDPEAGMQRIRDALANYELSDAGLERVVVVLGDLERPRLGLSQAAFDRLSETVDAIVHNGARIDWAMSYTELRSANVDGTREVLQLAARHRRKPLHYISTMFTLNPSRDGTIDPPFDEDRRAGWQGLENGYAQTKWVAERMVLDAAELGLDVSVHRMDFVVGDTRCGKLRHTDFLVRLFQDILIRGQMPREHAELSIVPVDHLAAEMVPLMLGRRDGERVFHYCADEQLSLAHLHELFTDFGYDIEAVAYDKWVVGATDKPAGVLFPLLFLLRQYSSALLEQWQAHELYAERTYRKLEANAPGLHAAFPTIREIVLAMVRHMHATGLVDQAPTVRQSAESSIARLTLRRATHGRELTALSTEN